MKATVACLSCIAYVTETPTRRRISLRGLNQWEIGSVDISGANFKETYPPRAIDREQQAQEQE